MHDRRGFVTTADGVAPQVIDPAHGPGGPSTIETFRALGAVDKLELVMLPFMVGAGMRLTPSLDATTALSFESSRTLPGGSVEIVYSLRG